MIIFRQISVKFPSGFRVVSVCPFPARPPQKVDVKVVSKRREVRRNEKVYAGYDNSNH
jgi:hypothetical protein